MVHVHIQTERRVGDVADEHDIVVVIYRSDPVDDLDDWFKVKSNAETAVFVGIVRPQQEVVVVVGEAAQSDILFHFRITVVHARRLVTKVRGKLNWVVEVHDGAAVETAPCEDVGEVATVREIPVDQLRLQLVSAHRPSGSAVNCRWYGSGGPLPDIRVPDRMPYDSISTDPRNAQSGATPSG